MNGRRLRRAVLTIAIGVAMAAVAAPGAAARLVPPSDSPFGHTYAAWDVVWGTAQAKRSLQSRNSLLAMRANRCGFAWSQRVWLLPASINGLITVSCRIPAGMYLVFPVAGVVAWGEHPDVMRADVRAAFPTILDSRVTVDGRDLGRGHVTRTPVYTVKVPAGNVFGEPAGLLSLISTDYFAVLSPLPRGAHTVSAWGLFDSPGGASELGMTFNLRVG
jgi:hypothetical protein